jgi:citronellol/citronellal dehydrogenase
MALSRPALERFTQGVAQEVAQYDGITIAALSPSLVTPTPGTIYHKLVAGIDDPKGEPPILLALGALLLASETPIKANGRVTCSQQILKEFGCIVEAKGRGPGLRLLIGVGWRSAHGHRLSPNVA